MKHRCCSFLETTCLYSLQSDKYREYCLIYLYLSLLLNLRLKLICCLGASKIKSISIYLSKFSSCKFSREKEDKKLQGRTASSLKISQKSQERICAGVSFLIKLHAYMLKLIKWTLSQRWFPVNFAKK